MASSGDLSGPESTGPPAIFKDFVLLQLAALVFLADQFTKFLTREFLPNRGDSFPLDGFFRIHHVHNTGSAFGLFPDQNTALILVAFLGITILALLYRNLRPTTNLLRLSLGLQMGGAAGNLLDRLLLGHVTDFVDIGPWPVFNVADSSIVSGLVLLFFLHGIPWERFGRRVPGEAVAAETDQLGLKEQYQTSWCPVCDGVMEAVTQGWRCSACGVKERIEQVADRFKPLPEDTTLGETASAGLARDDEGVRSFGENQSHPGGTTESPPRDGEPLVRDDAGLDSDHSEHAQPGDGLPPESALEEKSE